MVKGICLLCVFVLTCGVVCAQNSNSSTTSAQRPRTNTNRTKPVATETQTPATPTPKPTPKKTTAPKTPGSEGVLAAFNKLLDGIRHANVDEVMSVYWNNPQLNMFNYNGSVTKGWEQVRKNRESSYPGIKNAKLHGAARSALRPRRPPPHPRYPRARDHDQEGKHLACVTRLGVLEGRKNPEPQKDQ